MSKHAPATKTTGSTGSAYVRELFGKYLPENKADRAQQIGQSDTLELPAKVLAKIYTPLQSGAVQNDDSAERA